MSTASPVLGSLAVARGRVGDRDQPPHGDRRAARGQQAFPPSRTPARHGKIVQSAGKVVEAV
ncbi:hypothetical protein [Saccharopolyspora spinosa]|nr:hypothetical protein [Saccharopolyspora spinosa]